MGKALIFLQPYYDGKAFLDDILTGNETHVEHLTPEIQLYKMHCQHIGSPSVSERKPHQEYLFSWRSQARIKRERKMIF
ncbi:hypothetical protein NPIL_345201 [Nephila pilipes]|uniref:Uncharacterized protein n=1 Tax=Nephila pilipes TaxID=299642 RepID=A0A8X6NEZ6_NEPPI|nr:hypothetical protein NPIL_345201 [Nephila pilipes]